MIVTPDLRCVGPGLHVEALTYGCIQPKMAALCFWRVKVKSMVQKISAGGVQVAEISCAGIYPHSYHQGSVKHINLE